MQQHLRSSLFFIFLFFACLVAHGHETGDTLSVPLKSQTAQLDSLRFSVLPSSLRALDSLVYKSKAPKANFHLPWEWSEFDDLSKKYLPPLASDLLHFNFQGLSHQSYGFIPRFLPKKTSKEERWRNIPADCRIDWKRHREHFLWDLGNDIATYFNTFDTTYIERTRYDFQVKLYNTHFLQLIRLSGTDATGSTQSLTFAPAHEVKLGPYFAWKALSIG